jgi:hypothetical protein
MLTADTVGVSVGKVVGNKVANTEGESVVGVVVLLKKGVGSMVKLPVGVSVDA